MAMFSPSGRGSGCFPTYLLHPRSSRSHGSLYRAFRCVLCDWRKRLEHVSASSRSIGVFFTRARRVRAFLPPRVHVAATSSPLSELRLERQRRRRCHRRMAADMWPPAGFTPTIATISMAREVETGEWQAFCEGLRCSGEGLRPLRLIPELVGPPPVCLWNVRRVRRSVGNVLRLTSPSSSAWPSAS